jgi:hypothetical protein
MFSVVEQGWEILKVHLSWMTYIQKVARFITRDTIVSVIISTRQDENCDEVAQMKWFSGTLGIFLSSWLTLLYIFVPECP